MKKQQEIRGETGGTSGSIDAFIGLLAGKTKKIPTIEEMNEAIERGWSRRG